MAANVVFNSWIWILFSLVVLANVVEVKPTNNNTLDPSANSTNGGYLNKGKNCSFVVGGAVAGAVILPLVIGLPLVFCLCCRVMAGSIDVCRQTSNGKVPTRSCCACLQSLGAGGGILFIKFACIVAIPIGLCLGGFYTNNYHYRCFQSW